MHKYNNREDIKRNNKAKKGRHYQLIIFLLLVTSIVAGFFILSPSKDNEEDLVRDLKEPQDSNSLKDIRYITHTVGHGDTLDKICTSNNISTTDFNILINSFREYFDPRRCQVGDRIDFGFDHKERLASFRYEASPVEIYEATRIEDRYEIKKVNVPVTTQIVEIEAKLENSMYQAFLDIGESPLLVELLVDILAWDVDFFSDPRKGDYVSLVVEKKFVNGDFYDYGKVLAVHYDGRMVDRQAFYFEKASGKAGYFDEKGRSIARNFLKSPVKFTRISSRFGRRRHPVTHKLKNHLGTDYAAPRGTPVWAMGDGVVLKKAYGRANGNYIVIKHTKRYQTYYLHLSRFAPGIYVGKKVKQKDVIGYVGSTGLSTGPHLHLSVKRNRNFIDPLKLKKVKITRLAAGDMDEYLKKIRPMIALLERNVKGKTLDTYVSKDEFLFDPMIDMSLFPAAEGAIDNEDIPLSLSRRTEFRD